MKKEIVVILPNIRSAMNVGAIFRTAEAAGISKIYLCGYTATPNHPKVGKTALGSEADVAWEYFESLDNLILTLKSKGFQILALEIDKHSENLWDTQYSYPVALVLGNEISGIPKEILKICDKTVYIPMLGKKESLNVATAAGIAIFELVNKQRIA
jgi:23S rRNA (guanosine2251-2'-O)-methyltransferase